MRWFGTLFLASSFFISCADEPLTPTKDPVHDAGTDAQSGQDSGPPGADTPTQDTPSPDLPDAEEGGPPQWPEGAEISAATVDEGTQLSWPAAQAHDGGVVTYQLSMNGGALAQVSELEFISAELRPLTTYRFEVQAGDAQGRWSTDGPSIGLTTPDNLDPGFRRLTREQFIRSLADLHGGVWQPRCESIDCPWQRDAQAWYERITTYGSYWGEFRDSLPEDAHTNEASEPRGGFQRLDQTVYDEHVGVWLGAVMHIADSDYERWVGWRLVFNPCFDANSRGETQFETDAQVREHCIARFIDDFGKRAFRRDLTEDEHSEFAGVYADSLTHYAEDGLDERQLAARGLRNVVAVISSSPEFLYHVEVGDEEGNLSAWELASRLSYHFWNTMPDEELFAAAQDGRLLTEAGYEAQVNRMAADPRARRSIGEFYRDFFRVQDLPDLRLQDGPGRNYHNGPDGFGNTTGNNNEAMASELTNLGLWFTFDEPGTYEEMFRSNLHFLECQPPAHRPETCFGAGPYSLFSYGIEGCENGDDPNCTGGGWDGVSQPIELPEEQRAGLLTRLALLAHDTAYARPIRRGLYIRQALMCETIPPPESCDVVKPPEVDVYMTVRERVEAITEQDGTSCAGCHSDLINGLGHPLGHFSSRGQYWERERMFSDQQDSNGDYWYFLAPEDEWRDVDTTGTTWLNGEFVTIDGADDLVDKLAESGSLEKCWAREYFRFSIGRLNRDSDRAAIDSLTEGLREGGSLADAFKAVAHLPQFKTLYRPSLLEVHP